MKRLSKMDICLNIPFSRICIFFSISQEFYGKLPEEQKASFKQELLNLLQSEPNRNVRRKLVDLVAEVSRNLMDDDGNNLWPEFLKFLFGLASSPSPELKESALLLFG